MENIRQQLVFTFYLLSLISASVLLMQMNSRYFQRTVSLCPDWQDLFDFHFNAPKYGAKLCLSSISPSRLKSLHCCNFPPATLLSPPALSSLWKVKNTLAGSSFENRATPKTIRGGGREMCVPRILKEHEPSGYTDLVSPFWFPKTKEFQRKSGQDLTPSHGHNPRLALTLSHKHPEEQQRWFHVDLHWAHLISFVLYYFEILPLPTVWYGYFKVYSSVFTGETLPRWKSGDKTAVFSDLKHVVFLWTAKALAKAASSFRWRHRFKCLALSNKSYCLKHEQRVQQ